ncbi:MAG TPA: hypothetical protein VFH61_02780 [Thermoleophilia bacterium]|nr:hypothetical protein [Thermoleophilia bacterium]
MSKLTDYIKRVKPCTDDQLHAYLANPNFFGIRWARNRITMRPACREHTPPFQYIADSFFDRYDAAIIWACRGGGKTYGGATITALEAIFKPGIEQKIIGASEKQARKMFNKFVPMMEANYSHLILHLTKERCELVGDGLVEALTASNTSIMGDHIPRVRIDEIDELHPDVLRGAKAIAMASDRHGHHYDAKIELLSTYHRPYGNMHEEVARLTAAGAKHYKWCVFDVLQRCAPSENCKKCVLWEECQGVAKIQCNGHIPVRNARLWKQIYDPEEWRSFFLCEEPFKGGLFFKQFTKLLHVAEAPIPYNSGLPLYRGIDFGSNDPTHVVWVQENKKSDGIQAWVIDEWRKKGGSLSENAVAVQRYHHEKGYRATKGDFADPSGLPYIREWNKLGFRIIPGPKRNDRASGQEAVRRLLRTADGKIRIQISPNCQYLIREMGSLHYPDPRPGQPRKEDHVKVDDHAVDALRYIIRARFPVNDWQLVY